MYNQVLLEVLTVYLKVCVAETVDHLLDEFLSSQYITDSNTTSGSQQAGYLAEHKIACQV